MSPSQIHSNRDDVVANSNVISPSRLKINKNSHSIKKSSSSSSSSPLNGSLSGLAAKPPQQQRHPVIIYTHSPKVIHTHPRDFMALVQKLTGLSRSDDEDSSPKTDVPATEDNKNYSKDATNYNGDDNESSANSSSSNNNNNNNNVGDVQVMNNSGYFVNHQPNNPCNLMNNIPVFASNSADFYCPSQSFYELNDSFLFGGPSMRTSTPVPSLLEGMNEFHDF